MTLYKCAACQNIIESNLPLQYCEKCKSTTITTGNSPGFDSIKTLAGFKLIKKLGTGGMGDVWLAEQKSMNRIVALKIIHTQLSKNPNLINRFLVEIKRSAKLEHPNIVTTFESGECDGIYYLASMYIRGKLLRQLLDEKKVIPETESLNIALGIAKALKYAWEEFYIIHRDIKPGNIIVDLKGEPKLIDLGASKDFYEDNSLTVDGHVIGTPNYMSPEQAMSKDQIDFRADIYSLGATLYHISTGFLPFEASSNMYVIAKHITEELQPPIKKNQKITPAFNDLICKMMDKDKECRHQSWQEVIDDIRSILNGAFPINASCHRMRRKSLLKVWNLKKIYHKRILMFLIAVICMLLVFSAYTSYQNGKTISGIKMLTNESRLSLNFDDFIVKSETIVKQLSDFIKEKAETEFKTNDIASFIKFFDSIEPLIKTSASQGGLINGAWFTVNPKLFLADSKNLLSQHRYLDAWFYWENGILQKATFNEEGITSENAPFFYEPVKSNRMIFVKPYIDADVNKEMISFAQPVYLNDTLLGVTGIDVETDKIKKELENIKLKMEEMSLYIFDSEGFFVSGTRHPSMELSQFLKKAITENDKKVFDEVNLIKDNLIIIDAPKSKGIYFVAEILIKNLQRGYNTILWVVYIISGSIMTYFLYILFHALNLTGKSSKHSDK